MEPLWQWLQQQYSRGLWIKFARESGLSKEPELIADIGIYGSRAVGMQEPDDDCCTVRLRTVREIIDRILLSPRRGEGRVRGIKRDSYFSSGPNADIPSGPSD